ncbi:S-acyl fatty acid synthase thioesterase, medium chain isoform X2 [Ornithorhynchus anatinus]|uniref:S-acyl fatty acid synthase thioesterase, medium chain isoform X2 n=1 Tax=Ornithorhynchus anatinus TaxID=9258 RepID=UPI0010A93D07|nr:S-acyl fatty acid synthase thioesterase, medium chain isoform X2 [Ornithorhynchus anatinus]
MKKLVNCMYRRPDALFRLICFPWGGGGSVYFAKWGKDFPHLIEVSAIRLAGRESRSHEPFATDMAGLVEEIVNTLLPTLREKPFTFFGHSFGSMLAFMTALHLMENHQLQPVHLFLSGAFPPHSRARERLPKSTDLTEDQFVQFLLDAGGTPEEVLDNKECLEQFIPILRADAALFEEIGFAKPAAPLLSCNITCFDGIEDIPHDLEDREHHEGRNHVCRLYGWKDLTSGSCDIHKRPGGHFYLKEESNEAFIRKYITVCLESA